MLENLLRIIAPHHCYLCGQAGYVLCDSCIKNIKEDAPERCIVCAKTSLHQLCGGCKVRFPFDMVYFAGYRQGALKSLIDDYKFQRKKEASKPIAGILSEIIPILPTQTCIISVPSSRKHIRQRGYDHMELVAKQLAHMRGFVYQPVITRTSQKVQTGRSAKIRKQQVVDMCEVSRSLEPSALYVVIDDVYTTGATAGEMAKILKKAGARHILLAIIARHDEAIRE